VIQDELHLISGTVGTVRWIVMKRGSTASVRTSRAGDRRLFVNRLRSGGGERADLRTGLVRSSVQIFPPPGPDRRNSFFAETVTDSITARMYLGVAGARSQR